MNCARCGVEIPPDTQSCPNCGLKLKAAPRPAVPAGPVPATGMPPQPGYPARPPAGIPEGPPLVAEMPQAAPGAGVPPPAAPPTAFSQPPAPGMQPPGSSPAAPFIPSSPEPAPQVGIPQGQYVPGQIRPEARGPSKPDDEDGSYGIPQGASGGYDIHDAPPGAYVPEAQGIIPPAVPYQPPGGAAQQPYFSPSDASTVPPPQYTSPGDAFAVQHAQSTWPPPGPVPAAGRAGRAPMEKGTKVVLIIAVAAIVVIGAAAAVYFIAFNKKSASPQEEVVIKYFDALSKGDTSALQALFVPGQGYSEQELAMMKTILGTGLIKYENPRLSTTSVEGNTARVLLEDVTITVSMGGQTVSKKLSEYVKSGDLTFVLNNVNGQWLLTKQGAGLPNLQMPTVPGI